MQNQIIIVKDTKKTRRIVIKQRIPTVCYVIESVCSALGCLRFKDFLSIYICIYIFLFKIHQLLIWMPNVQWMLQWYLLSLFNTTVQMLCLICFNGLLSTVFEYYFSDGTLNCVPPSPNHHHDDDDCHPPPVCTMLPITLLIFSIELYAARIFGVRRMEWERNGNCNGTHQPTNQ